MRLVDRRTKSWHLEIMFIQNNYMVGLCMARRLQAPFFASLLLLSGSEIGKETARLYACANDEPHGPDVPATNMSQQQPLSACKEPSHVGLQYSPLPYL